MEKTQPPTTEEIKAEILRLIDSFCNYNAHDGLTYETSDGHSTTFIRRIDTAGNVYRFNRRNDDIGLFAGFLGEAENEVAKEIINLAFEQSPNSEFTIKVTYSVNGVSLLDEADLSFLSDEQIRSIAKVLEAFESAGTNEVEMQYLKLSLGI